MTQFTIISDTTPLIAFIKKDELTLLRQIFNIIIIPQAVFDELTANPHENKKQSTLILHAVAQKWIKIQKLKSIHQPLLHLGKGEIEAINLCFETKSPLLLIDEKKGRTAAKINKIPVLGTIGILLAAKKKKLKKRTELMSNLDQLLEKDFYLSSEIISKFYQELDK